MIIAPVFGNTWSLRMAMNDRTDPDGGTSSKLPASYRQVKIWSQIPATIMSIKLTWNFAASLIKLAKNRQRQGKFDKKPPDSSEGSGQFMCDNQANFMAVSSLAKRSTPLWILSMVLRLGLRLPWKSCFIASKVPRKSSMVSSTVFLFFLHKN